MGDYLAGLNEQQREAVLQTEGPVLIVAGAGSGKTRVLTTRIAHLLAQGVEPFHILALTFTNKAAREMVERVEQLLGNSNARNLYIGTFHSVFARILRSEADKMGYPRHFTIYDTDDSKSVLKTVIKELHLDEGLYKPNIVYNRISSAKNALIGPAEYLQDYSFQQQDLRAKRPAIGQIYQAYTHRCFRNGAMDFDDLLFKFYELLISFPEALSKYQRKFRYILIDEYQDTNPAQYQIIKLLGAMHENICVVGDDAQSIYSFRGATIQNILQFRHDYEDVKIIKLEQNYRSTKSILSAANEVIKQNKNQIEKILFTKNHPGEPIRLVRTMTDNDEGKFVADCIQEQKLRNHYQNKDFAVLYRTNAQSRAFEEALRRMGIPYTVYGGISFFQRKEIKDFVAYLKVIVNPKDEEALKRIINYPNRGIGKITLDKLILTANDTGRTMWDIMEQADRYGFKGATLEAIQNFVIMMKSFSSMLQKHNAYDIAVHVGKQTGIIKELFNDKTNEGIQRYENIQELLNSIKEWTDSPDNEEGELVDKSLGAYLQQITLLTDADEKDYHADTVKLMTIHSAKGLEFPCVFVVGLEEMLFPNAMSVNSRDELEEERRLFYVAITRAKEKVWICYANMRYRFGQLTPNEPSRFISEIPEHLIDFSKAGRKIPQYSDWQNFETGDISHFFAKQKGEEKNEMRNRMSGMKRNEIGRPSSPKTETPPQDFQPSDISEIQVGKKVQHLRFGFGTVIKMEGAAHNPIATIVFEQAGEKKIMLNYARIRIVNE
ncbi:MAG: exodeoxyribonuclease V subunit gamma [Chitinophagaceae bacterium]|nr:exodeoxyribonuclease V subunit gamma [Chitinophagaceae bacterium]